jgi:hypothetical protein
MRVIRLILGFLQALFLPHAALAVQNLALRQQLAVHLGPRAPRNRQGRAPAPFENRCFAGAFPEFPEEPRFSASFEPSGERIRLTKN